MTPNYACRKVITIEREDDLSQNLVTRSKMAYGLSPNEFRGLAFETAKINNLTIPVSWKQNES